MKNTYVLLSTTTLFLVAAGYFFLKNNSDGEGLQFVQAQPGQYITEADQYQLLAHDRGLVITAEGEESGMNFAAATGNAAIKEKSGALEIYDIAEGVDLKLYDKGDRKAGYDITLAPGTNLAMASFQISGRNAFVTASGELAIPTETGQIRHSQPYAYQEIDGKKVEVESHFVVEGNYVSFETGDYDPAYALVIDPEIRFLSEEALAEETGSFQPMAAPGPGDILFVGLLTDGSVEIAGNCDQQCGDGFAFAVLEDIDPGQEIFFTEDEYSGGSFENNEGTVKWTAPAGGVSAGTVVQITTSASDSPAGCIAGQSASVGTIVFEGVNTFALGSNEEIFAYLGTALNPTTWLAAIITDNIGDNDIDASIASFTFDTEAAGEADADVAIYTGATDCASKAACQTAIMNTANWQFEDDPPSLSPPCEFDCCDNEGPEYPDDVPASFPGIAPPPPALPTITVSASPANILDYDLLAQTATYTFTRDNTSGPLTVNFSVGGTATFSADYTQTGAASFTTTSGSVTFADGNATAMITIDPIDDIPAEVAETVILTITSDAAYSIGSPANATVTINDFVFITIAPNGAAPTPASTEVSENGTKDEIKITLSDQPAVGEVVVFDITSNAPDEVMLTGSNMLTFTNGNWDTPQFVEIMGVDDNILDGTQAGQYFEFSVNTTLTTNDAYKMNGPMPGSGAVAFVTVLDNDVAGFTITESGGMTMTDESGTMDQFDVVLDVFPLTDVQIVLTPQAPLLDEIDLGAGAGNSITLTFTNANGTTPQTVTVTGLDDAIQDGDITGNIVASVVDASSDDAFDALADQTISVTNKDNEIATIRVSGNGLEILNGDISPELSDLTSFGLVNISGTPVSRTFLIENTGNFPLNISSVTSDEPFFSVVNSPTMIPGGNSSNLEIQFDPSGLTPGNYTATITINSDAANGATFTYTVGATVFDPDFIPTMGQWAFLLFGLVIFTLCIVGLYNYRYSFE